MERVFYDQHGIPIAYTLDGEYIYLFTGEPVAYFYDESIYSFSGWHLGLFEDEWIRDNSGRCVFYTEETTGGGPARRAKRATPAKRARRARPAKRARRARPATPAKRVTWSILDPEQFFKVYQ